MGKFTALDDPLVDQTVETHLQRIVAAVRSRMEAHTIILHGSFGRGEGSVLIEGSGLHFLSDYELSVATSDFRDRETLRIIGVELTAQLGVETSITWFRLSAARATSAFPNTIAHYEMQNGGLLLYGEPVTDQREAIDPGTITEWSALRLLLNRMAESLHRCTPTKDWDGLRLITKTVLACSDALLVVNRKYHFSYAERGRRFEKLAPQLGDVVPRTSDLAALVRRATAFKLQPSLDCYHAPMPIVWRQTKQICDATFRHTISRYLGFAFERYAEFPELYRRQLLSKNKLRHRYVPILPASLSQSVFLCLRHLHDRHRLPIRLIACATYPAYQIVYSVVPLAFFGGDDSTLREARRWLGKVETLRPLRNEGHVNWEYLRRATTNAWKDYCYGLWEEI
jgi:hypothetical protein